MTTCDISKWLRSAFMTSFQGVQYGRLSVLRRMLIANQYWRAAQVVNRMQEGDCVIEDEEGDYPYSDARSLVPLFYRELQKDKEGLLYSLGEYLKTLADVAEDGHVADMARETIKGCPIAASALRDWLIEQHGECVESEELLFVVNGEWQLN